MLYATTTIGQLVTGNYPFGHGVNRVASSVCWILANQRWRVMRNWVSPNRAWIETGKWNGLGENTLVVLDLPVSTGARRGTGYIESRVSVRRKAPRHTMSGNRHIAHTEKARCANTGPSRDSMSVVVGIRSDRRQTA